MGISPNAPKRIEHAFAPLVDRVIRLKQRGRTGAARPHEVPEQNVVGIERRGAAEIGLSLERYPHRLEHLTKRGDPRGWIADDFIEGHAEALLAGATKVVAVLLRDPFENVRNTVMDDWRRWKAVETNEAFLAKLRNKYGVVIDPDAKLLLEQETKRQETR